EELPGGSANAQIPLLVRADMANFDVHRVLVDPSNSIDIMYAHLYETFRAGYTGQGPRADRFNPQPART
ncbi:hypothetical protein A2U01_0075129, partial [Trifolium medium]|nr:hypothetical protein [Trifolium medium]